MRYTAKSRQSGFTFVWLLFFVVAMGIGLAALGNAWHTLVAREKEQELLFVGDQYRKAIAAFLNASPKGQERLPKSLDELLEDPRFPNPVRELRRPYRDPITGSAEWGLVKTADGGISGVYSLSNDPPFKTANFPQAFSSFAGLGHYRDWVFSSTNTASSNTAGSADSTGTNNDQGNGNASTGSTQPANSANAAPPQSNPCSQALQQSLAACQQAVAAGTVLWGTCRNAAISTYRSCSQGQ